jgi:hypothetical protein
MKTQEDLEIEEFLKIFGIAVFCAQQIEYSMVNLFAASERLSLGLNVSVRDLMDARYKHTLGKLINDACSSLNLSDPMCSNLRSALLERNWLIHHFFKEYGAVGISSELRKIVIPRLVEARIMFEKVSEDIHQEALKRLQDAGLSEQEVQKNIEDGLNRYFTNMGVARDES